MNRPGPPQQQNPQQQNPQQPPQRRPRPDDRPRAQPRPRGRDPHDAAPTAPIRGGPAAEHRNAPPPPEAAAGPHRWWLGAARTATAVASSVVLVATGVAWSEYENLASGLTTSSALHGAGRSKNGAVNILLIGLDSRKDQDGNPLPKDVMSKLHAGDGNEGGYNTNTLIMLHVPANGGPAKAFSIPRDDQVDIPGTGPDKIKKAYGLAKAKAETKLRGQGVRDQSSLERRSRDAGRRATLDVVRTLTGQPVDHFAEVNLAGFYDLASALGGVPVCLNHPVSDDYSGANFPAGRQQLNASQALSFVRQRHGLTNGDLDRTHRQQAFLTSVASKLRSSGTFTSTSKLQGLINVAKKDVVIDSDWDVLSFAQQAPNLTGGNMQFQTLPIQGYGKKGGEEINLIDPAKIRAIIHATFDGAPPPPAPRARASSANEAASTTPQASHLAQSPAGPPAGSAVGGSDVPCVN